MPLFGRKSRKSKNKASRDASVSHEPTGTSNAEVQDEMAAAPKKKKSFFDQLLGKKDRSHKPKDKLKDRHVKFKRSLGGGTANDVSMVNYSRGIGDTGVNTGYFKADWDQQAMERQYGNEGFNVHMPGAGYLVGIGDEDTRNAARSVASARVDRLLGTEVVSQDTFAKHDGKIGSVSPAVVGDSMKYFTYGDTDLNAEGRETRTSPHKAMAENLVYGGKYKVDGDQVFVRDDIVHRDIDYDDANIQRGLLNLQLNDFLTGQVDRHEANILINPDTGRVTGIDNDLAFGSAYADDFAENGVSHNMGMPSLFDGEVAERIAMMEGSEFEKTLRGRDGDYGFLNDAEVESAMGRFYALQAHIEELLADPTAPDSSLIYNFGGEEVREQMLDDGRNYMQRAHHRFHRDESPHQRGDRKIG